MNQNIKLYTGISLLLLSITCIADPVTKQTAQKVAINALQERVSADFLHTKTINITSIQHNNIDLIYILNFESPIEGFIMVAADNSIIPVIAYSLNGHFQAGKIPSQLQYLLTTYEDQILFSVENKINPPASVLSEWARLDMEPIDFIPDIYVDEVPPLISSTWDQWFPYNEYCPSGTPVGCVAICMGQVMKYWSHPAQGEGSHGYTHYNYGYLFADFGATTYNFANMPHDETVSNPDLATLLFHCGVAVEMNYTPTSSGSLLDGYHGAENALKSYFKFDPSLHHEKKFQFADSVWRQMIITDLEQGFPVIYGGWDGWTGHAWNLDGYEKVTDQYHYHMNWGWGGSYNGYYYLDDLSPGYGQNYTDGQEAIFNITPFATNILTCYPGNSDYQTGSTTSSTKIETSPVKASDPEDGWMSFDISAIPDGAEIYAVSFNGYVYERYKPNWSITPVYSDPVTTDAATLHADIIAEQSAGYYYRRDEANINYPVDWRTYMLAGYANSDLQAALVLDKFTLGIANDYNSYLRYIRFHGWNEANPPYLRVYYTAYGSIEGYVTEFGSSTPVGDVFVTIGHYSDTTASNGYYKLENVPIGSYDVMIDPNGQANANGNPYFIYTIPAIISDGQTTQLDIGIKWAEIELNPQNINVSIDPFEIQQSQIAITNNGPGMLEYACHVEPPMGPIFQSWDAEAATGDDVIYGCVSDGEYIWITGRFASYGDHKLYKLSKEGELLQTYSQGTTSQWGMKRMTFDGTFIYSYDVFGFYRIDPTDGTITTLFTDYPTGLYTMAGLTWVPGLGFISNYEDEDLFIFDYTGQVLGRLATPGENFYASDIAYDHINNCLWLAKNSTNFYYQYDLLTESLTGLFYEVPTFPNCSFQSTAAVFFTTDLFQGKSALCGLTYGNPINNFFALELETWLQVVSNKSGMVSGSAKGSLNINLEINAGEMTALSKSANVVISHNAGTTEIVPVTMTNNYTQGDIEGYVYKYGTTDPIQNAILSIDGNSDITDESGYYSISGIPIGTWDLICESADYINDTLTDTPICGITKQQNVFLKWTDMVLNPPQINVTVPPGNLLQTSFSIANNGTGDLVYNCEVTFPGSKDNFEILVVDRDFSHMDYFGTGDEYPFDEWYAYQMALDDNNFSYTYYQVWYPWDNGPDLATMLNYDLILWFSGEIYGGDAVSTIDEINLASYMDNGGNLFMASYDYFSKFGWSFPLSLDPGDFPYDYLGVQQVLLENWDIWFMGSMEGMEGSFAQSYNVNFFNPYDNSGLYPPGILNHSGTDLFKITNPIPEGICAVQYDGGNFKTVYTGVSFALIDDPTTRSDLLLDLVNFYSSALWLSIESNESGVVAGQSEASIDVGININAANLSQGTYNADILIHSNDANPLVAIPVILTVGDIPGVDLKVFLQGPFEGSEMSTALNVSNLIPFNQPFNVAPWNYSGTESVTSIPNANITDWILVEFRDALDAASADLSTRMERQAAFLLKNGSIVGIDGMSYIQMNTSVSDNLFVVLSHRNHLDILSANPVTTLGGVLTYDFTSGESQVYGNNAGHTEMAPGIWGMTAGNGIVDLFIDNQDKDACWETEAGQEAYLQGDFNLDGQVDNKDKDDFWHPNLGKGSQVPQ
ncbi:MAG: C10 family peptidase [Bacteroidales bacterium]|nr:C10 family peptidase [Bacteroidales bacterium]